MGTIILKYQENFADNFSQIAYGKLIEKSSTNKCYFTNEATFRANFEKSMSNFNIDLKYLSKNQISLLTKKSYYFSKNMINSKFYKKSVSDKILNTPRLKIDDIKYINDEIKADFKFKNLDFIFNFDILDEIQTNNSIGLYINKKDMDKINLNYIYKAVERLNKYLKKPVLYIFSQNKIDLNEDLLQIKHKFIRLHDWREEFYFLTQCRNKIIMSCENSYSEAIWATLLNNSTNLIAFDYNLKTKKPPENWIKILF